MSLPRTDHEYNGKFHAVQNALSHKANMHGWKVFSQSNARARKAGLHSCTKKENPENCSVNDARQCYMASQQVWQAEITL